MHEKSDAHKTLRQVSIGTSNCLEIFSMLILPALDLSDEVLFLNLPKHRTLLFSHGRKLIVLPREVMVVTGAVLNRKLIYGEDIVDATYTSFQHGVPEGSEALVICLRTSAHIYLPGGNSHIVSFPFTLKSAFPFDSGMLLERENDQDIYHNSFSLHRFFTLVDPFGEYRVVTTSSTSVVTAGETLLYFPSKGLGKSRFLCVTFNSRQRAINVYHVKASTRNKVVGPNALKRKRNIAMTTPNPSRIFEDELYEPIQPPFAPNVVLSINMDKKRTSTLLSGASSIARMGSESGFSEQGKPNMNCGTLEPSHLRKEMIWTKIDTFPIKARSLHLTVSSLIYENKEAVIISNRALKQATIFVYKLNSGGLPVYETSVNMLCLHALALNHSAFPGWLLLLDDSASILLVHPILEIKSPFIRFSESNAEISSIASTIDHLVVLRSATKARNPIYLNLILEPNNKLVKTCLRIWRHLSGSKLNESVWVIWRAAFMLDKKRDDWRAYVISILSLIFPFDSYDNSKIATNEVTELLQIARMVHEEFPIDYSLHDLLPYVVVSLHLIYEETRLNALNESQLVKLGSLLAQLTIWMGWLEHWTSYYMIDENYLDSSVKILLTSLMYHPPNIYDHLTSVLENKRTRFLQISQLVEESDSINQELTPRTSFICELFVLIASSKVMPEDVVQAFHNSGFSSSDLETFPSGIRIPLKNFFQYCQKDPKFEWDTALFDLLGRRDLPLLSKIDYTHPENIVHSNLSNTFSSRDAGSIVDSLSSKHESFLAWDEQSEADRLKITKLIFDKDRRFYEITSILHQTRIQTAIVDIKDGMSEYDSTLLKREVASLVALRTLTIPLGRAALFYAGKVPLLTEKFPIPKFNLNTLITPSMTTIVLAEGSIKKSVLDWGHFHNGVSSGLSVSPSATCISGSWVIYNKPAENNAQHAGFLLGLGLNGHLKLLEEWHIYNYLGPKHPLTSVGLLIGMAASMKGTMENKLTKVLSVHAVALLPQGANDLNVPIIVQSAGLIGIGLLYLETQHRRMSEILLSQLESYQPHAENDDEEESYKLAAGVALGFINLGKGHDLKGLNDTHVINKLLSFAISMKDLHSADESDKSSSGAIIALCFIFLKTRNVAVALKLQIPNSEQLIDYVRPDLLLLRCFAQNMIMWDDIHPTKDWIEGQVPDVLKARHDINNLTALDSDQINMFNILGGAFLSVAIKYASVHNAHARDILLHYLDITMMISTSSTNTYDQKLALSSVCQLQNLLCLCLSVIMAGSGDIEVFRRLRVLHGRVDKNYDQGSHMATSMALGILFLGGSQYGFDDSNFAIAALIVSLYPVFPNENSEIEVHLQVLRHFWSLSIQPRCLVIRDVKSGSPLQLPVKICYKNGSIQEVISPVLLNQMSQISSIEIDSKSYFKVSLSFLINSGYLEQFKKSLTIFVLRKVNYELLKASVGSLLENKAFEAPDCKNTGNRAIRRLLHLRLRTSSASFETDVFLREHNFSAQNRSSEEINSGLSMFNIFDDKLELIQSATKPKRLEDIYNLRLLLAFTSCKFLSEHLYLDAQFIEILKQSIWELTN